MKHSEFLQLLQASPGRERFGKYNFDNNPYIDCFEGRFYVNFEELPESFQLAALVDWLDSEGVFTNTMYCSKPYKEFKTAVIYKKEYFMTNGYKTRHDALRAGILKAITQL